jgi:murein DD-endopeptidase MepM/ murein hydrolase activator NlpD
MRSALALCLLLLVAAPPRAAAEVYTLRRGDTLYSVSRKFRVPLDELLRANNITDPSSLKVGTRVEIPQAWAEVRVQKGDTLFSLARRFGISVTDLRRINSLPLDHVLKIGESLRVPEAAWESDAQRRAPAPAAAGASEASRGVPYWPHPGTIRQLTGQLAPGVAIEGEPGDPVYSVSPGRVTWAAPFRGYGQIVFVRAENGVTFAYAGASELLVRVGDKVITGTRLATLGVHPHDGVAKVIFFAARGSEPMDPARAPRS